MSTPLEITRRHFLKSFLVSANTVALTKHLAIAQAPARYRRYNVTSAGGQKTLASYARGVQAMLKLPADHPHS